MKKIVGDKDEEEQMEIYFDGTHGFLRMGKSLVIIRLIDGEFPEYEQVIPKENDKKIRDGEREDLCLSEKDFDDGQ